VFVVKRSTQRTKGDPAGHDRSIRRSRRGLSRVEIVALSPTMQAAEVHDRRAIPRGWDPARFVKVDRAGMMALTSGHEEILFAPRSPAPRDIHVAAHLREEIMLSS
jgi:hypothetical protein